MRRHHMVGEGMFVDFASQTVEVIHGSTSEVRPTRVFIAVLGASVYGEPTWAQGLPDLIGVHGTFAFSGVDRACFNKPRINRGMATHR